MSLTLGNYIRDLRLRIDDDPYGGNYTFSDSDMTIFINNARRKISNDIIVYSNQDYIIPTLYKDEYALPNDFLMSDILIDVKNSISIPPTLKVNAESNRNWNNYDPTFGNFCYVNESRRKLCFYEPPTFDNLEPSYNIKEFNRSAGYLIIDGLTTVSATGTVSTVVSNTNISGTSTKFLREINNGDVVTIGAITYEVDSITNNSSLVVNSAPVANATGQTMYISHYTLADITEWDNEKGYIKITSAGGNVEYARVSRIYLSGTNEYTLEISGWDLKRTYKDGITLKGTCNVINACTFTYAVNSMFLTELTAGDVVTINSVEKTVVTISNDNTFVANSTYSANANSKTMSVENRPVFADNDTLKFATYLLNYSSLAPDLVYWNQIDYIPIEVQELVPILASVEAWMRLSQLSNAQQALNDYNTKLSGVNLKLRKDEYRAHNQGL